MAFTEDLTDFINDDTPGYVSADIAGIGVVGGILIDEYGEFGSVVAGNKPVLLCISAEVSAAENGTALVINSVNYTISGAPQPDGTGVTRFELSET